MSAFCLGLVSVDIGFEAGYGSGMENLTHAIFSLADAVNAAVRLGEKEFEWLKSHSEFATKHDLEETEQYIMSQVTDWAEQEQADLTAISGTLDTIVTGIEALDAKITALQNSPGTLSASDQAALDAIQVASKALVAKSAAISTAPPA